MEFRRVRKSDFDQILELQSKNLIWTLGPDGINHGFLATSFSLEQFQEMDRDICVIVCEVAGKVEGYLCGSTVQFNQAFRLPAAMLARCSELDYKGKPVASYEFFVAGPVCIRRDFHRPGEIYVGLVAKLFQSIDSRYEIALTFISTANLTSLNGARKRAARSAPMEVLGQFKGDNDDETFWILAFAMPTFRPPDRPKTSAHNRSEQN